MTYSFIDCEDDVDTVALQSRHPELFNVTSKDGVARWTLRPDVRAALRAPIEAAGRKWIAARDKLYATGAEEDKAAAIKAAMEFRASLFGQGKFSGSF
jgi:hypothetical protein